MEAIMILAVIAVFFINFIFIDNIYKIVDNSNKPIQVINENLDDFTKEALVIGDGEVCKEISCLLYKNNIASDILNNIDDIDKTYQYKYVLAVFNDDLENLTLCSITINIMGINNVVAICNKEYNKKIYDENKIITLNRYASASDVVAMLLNNHNKKEA